MQEKEGAMLEQWYMKSPEGSVGPLSLQELVKKITMAPDTLVRKADEKKWTPAFAHPDLKSYLKPVKPKAINDEADEETGNEIKEEKSTFSDVLVCEGGRRLLPPNLERWLIWVMLLLLALILGKAVN